MFCKGTFVIGENVILRHVYVILLFNTFRSAESPVSADSTGKLHLLSLPQGSAIPKNTRILFEVLNIYSKILIRLAGEKGVFLKNKRVLCLKHLFLLNAI